MENLLKFTKTAAVLGYPDHLPKVGATTPKLSSILNIVIGIIAAISILFIAIGALRYILSDGDPQKASRGKETVIYAVVGLLISITAEALVALVLNNLNGST